MTKWEELYHQIADTIPDTEKGKMFGALCIKALNGKSGVMFWRDDMIFKLPEKEAKEALELKGAKIFEPAPGRPMGGWIHVPNTFSNKWKKYAISSMKHVATIEAAAKPGKVTKAAKSPGAAKSAKAAPKKAAAKKR